MMSSNTVHVQKTSDNMSRKIVEPCCQETQSAFSFRNKFYYYKWYIYMTNIILNYTLIKTNKWDPLLSLKHKNVCFMILDQSNAS